MDPGQGFKIAARSPGGAHDPATNLESTHTLLQRSEFISPGPTSYVQNYNLITGIVLMINTLVLHQHIDETLGFLNVLFAFPNTQPQLLRSDGSKSSHLTSWILKIRVDWL